MFFKSKQKPKLDGKVRFQHAQFTRKLDEAKNYKRASRTIPEGAANKFLAGLGLQSWWSRVGVVLGVALLVYLVFIPNFLFVRKITIEGIPGPVAERVEVAAWDYVHGSRKGVPQANMLFLDVDELQRSVLLRNPLLLRITHVQKKYFGQLVITGVGKTERYVVGTQKGVYVLFNDASFSREFSADPTTFAAALPGLVKVRIESPVALTPAEPLLELPTLKAVEALQQQFGEATKNQVEYFEIPSVAATIVPPADTPPTATTPLVPAATGSAALNQQTIILWARKSSGGPHPEFRVFLDSNADIPDMASRLGLLFSEMQPDRYLGLDYIDFRLKQRAFVCLWGAACSFEGGVVPAGSVVPPPAPPTPTPSPTPTPPKPTPTPTKPSPTKK